ncbi:MAG: Hsp20/alpha crystallin family protein [Candidatus Krumholzibacteriia bacterium]
MFLTKYRPAGGLESFFEESLLPVLGECRSDEGNAFRLPRTNVNEDDKEFVLTMEMPGVKKGDVDVAIEDDHIVITGEKEEKAEATGLLRREIRSEKFRRSFALDASIDRDGIKAKLADGLLRVTLPKRAESVGRKISVD